MSRNSVIGLILIALIIILMPAYYKLVSPPRPPAPDSLAGDTLTIDTTRTDTLDNRLPVDTSRALLPVETPAVPDTISTAWIEADSAFIVPVGTELFDVEVSNRGAALVSIRLKEFTYVDGVQVEMIMPGLSAITLHRTFRFPFEPDVNEMLWVLEADGTDEAGARIMRFALRDTTGACLTKTFVFAPNRYDVGVEVALNDPGAFGLERLWTIGWIPGVHPTEPDLDHDLSYYKAYAQMGDELDDIDDYDDASSTPEGDTRWVGARSKYFLAAIVPDSTVETLGAELHNVKGTVQTDTRTEEVRISSVGIACAIDPDAGRYSFKVYAGPIDHIILRSYGVGMDEIVNFGWEIIRPISVGVLWCVTLLYGFVPNYGVAIILFTVIMKIVLMPLSIKSTKSMAKMSELQPKMKAIQAKYKEDQQRQSQELLKLYKTEGVNPVGGCLPMLLQMPIFYALFTVFRSTISLRQAHFALWISDLSVKDPYYVLPIIMGLTMFLSQRLAMRDPKQKMMVYMLPVVFTFLFKDMPAGLVLYWAMFNVLNLFEYQFVRKRMMPPSAVQAPVETPFALPDGKAVEPAASENGPVEKPKSRRKKPRRKKK
jgi:YidC/Oxa1 family membrane protein insertase